jgi:uncharacterized protein YndB with AHSA1/START domain
MSHTPLVIERVLQAPASRIWRALTDEAQMKQWYFDVSAFQPVVGFEFEFFGERDGVRFHHLCRVTEAKPDRKIAFTWIYKGLPGHSLVTIELFEEGDKTRVKLTHEGLETFPQASGDFARENFEGGWTHIIGTSLAKFVEYN